MNSSNIETIIFVGLFIEVFNNLEECIKVITKEKSDEKNSEAENLIYTNILHFLNLQKNKAIADRNILLIRYAVAAFDKEDGVSNLEFLATKKAFTLKLVRPTKIIKLCDNLLDVKITDKQKGLGLKWLKYYVLGVQVDLGSWETESQSRESAKVRDPWSFLQGSALLLCRERLPRQP